MLDSSTTRVLNLTNNVEKSFKIAQKSPKVRTIYGQQDYKSLALRGIAKRGKKPKAQSIMCVCSLCRWGFIN